jgi:putative peptidoglycan lipid II flippase
MVKKFIDIKRLLIPQQQEKVLEAIIRSSFINLATRGFGYLKQVTIAVLLGFNLQTDAFFMALSLIGLFLIFADVFDSIGVPNLVRARLRSEEEFKNLAGLLFTFTLILTFLVTLSAIFLYPLVLKIPVGFNKEALEYTKIAYFLLIPYLSLNFLFHHFGAILRSLRKFTPFFIGEFIFSSFSFLFTASGLLIFKTWLVLPIALSLSQIVATLYMLYTGREFLHIQFYVNEIIKKILKHFFYLSGLYGVFHLSIIMDRVFASLLGEKAISALTYGWIIASIPKGILKFENIAITSLSEVRGNINKINFYIKKILQITIPILIILFLFPKFFVKLLFGYGAFSNTDIFLTAEATKYYALSLPFMFLWPVLYRVFQIKDNLKPVFLIALAGVIINFILDYLFVVKVNLDIKGIALGTFGAYFTICGLSYIIISYSTKREEE